MGSADSIEVDGSLEATAGKGSVEKKERYFLELNGTLIDGHEPDDVARGLARLLRMTREQARQLLQGKPYRIHKELDKAKAEHLLAKVVACGAGAIVVPVHRQQRPQPVFDQRTPIESDVTGIQVKTPVADAVPTHLPENAEAADESSPEPADAPLESTLELDQGPADQDQEEPFSDKPDDAGGVSLSLALEQPAIEPDDEVTRPMEVVDPNDLEVEEQVVLETPAPFARSKEDKIAEDPGRFMAQPEAAAPSATERTKKKSAGPTRILRSLPDRRLLIGAGVVLVLVVAGWGALQFMGGSRPKPVVSQPVASPVDPKLASTRSRQDRLARSVKVWMIEYGSGFNPAQVTLARLQADLNIDSQTMLDGWGTAFRYQPGQARYILTSAGPDRQFDTADDLQRIETME